jgi:hypothetical protein
VREPIDPREQFSVTLHLYEGPDAYRVYELLSPLSPEQPLTPASTLSRALGLRTSTEYEAREKWSKYFEPLSA